jgi:1-deoxy-D-xylulose-5-phosphate synthase
MIVSAPRSEQDLRDMMYTASTYEQAAWAIRYPRGTGPGEPIEEGFQPMEIGKGVVLKRGEEIAILTLGPIASYAEEAILRAEENEIYATHVDMRFVKPLDTALLDELATTHHTIITVEDGTVVGGFGSAVAEYYADKDKRPKVVRLGVEDRIVEHGTQRELHDELSMGPDGIYEAILASTKEPVRRS